ncbi:hypothetical protein HID58_015028 [Brassica napus]|uniref:Uncharacterized protein n=2 Tax=Brassica TaxID=3705 RepID=A0ABQ8DLC8_BRANA|nr:hypothetical protein HID58_015028 [Brassica napus]
MDPVFGSAHCALAHYWSLKMNKCDFLAYQASRRNGTLEIHLDKEKQRVLLRGKAVTVMEGYVLVNAFTDSAFKGNPAVVCILDGKNERDDSWLQSLAAELNILLTCFVIPITGSHSPHDVLLRWFTPTLETQLSLPPRSGILRAKKISGDVKLEKGSFLIELDFPVIPTCDYNSSDKLMFSIAFSGATIVDILGTTTGKVISKAFNGASKASSTDKIIVVLQTWESVKELQPRMDDILKCPGKIIIVTAAAPERSVYDFCSRIFAPKLGVDEDAVCGSAHCALAHYWSLKMNKTDFFAYAASRRSGTVKVHYDKEKQRVLLTGKAVTVMKGHSEIREDTGMIKKKLVKYFVVDAFTESAFKGNPAAVCLLEEGHERDDSWLQFLAAEFHLPMTSFLLPITGSDPLHPPYRYICGHATLAAAHTVFSNGLIGSSDTVEFSTHSGILTAKRVDDCEAKGSFFIELNFRVITTCEYSSSDLSMLAKALNGATIVDVVLSSWESVIELQPKTDDIMKCPAKVIIVTAAAP